MSQKSEERVSDSVVPLPTKARVIPFERPQSELQKAVQQRAQETMDRERDRANQKPPAWRRALVLALAVIPVVLTFGAAVAFVGALRQFNSTVFDSPPDRSPSAATGRSPSAASAGAQERPPDRSPTRQAPPAATDAPTTQRDPGVVMLQPLTAPTPTPQTERANPPDTSK